MKQEGESYVYSRAEKILIGVAILAFLVMGYVYVADISIKRWLFPSAEDRLLSTPIGKVVSMSGKVLRQRANEFEFKPLAPGDVLYPNDTLMTGPDGTLAIELNDGQKFDLTPNSLVKLAFGTDFALTGLKFRIEVLQGQGATAMKKEATEEPKVPLSLSALNPPKGSVLRFTPEEFAEKKKAVKVSFKANQKPPTLTMHLFISQGPATPRRELSTVPLASETADVSTNFSFTAPGFYEWDVMDASGKIVGHSDFVIDRKIEMIRVHPTLNQNNRLEGAATKKSFEGFILRWKGVGGPGRYLIRIFKAGGKQLLLQKEMAATELILNKNQILLGKLHYSIEKELGGGFVAVSGLHDFGFAFLPPDPTAPPDGVAYGASQLAQTNRIIFFTWTKTNFTSNYRFELSTDAKFSKTVLKRDLRDNHLSLGAPKPGFYYWRVQSLAHGAWSDYSQTRSLQISSQ